MSHADHSREPDRDGHYWHSKSYVLDWVRQREADEQREKRSGEEYRWLSERIRIRPGAPNFSRDDHLRILDLGSGSGDLAERLLHEFPAAELVACDFSRAMLELSGQRLEKFGSRVRHVCADLEECAWLEGICGPFDAAVSVRALHHIRRDRTAELYRELASMLRPGGVFLNVDRTLPHLRMLAVDLVARFPWARTIVERYWPRWLAGTSRLRQVDLLASAGFDVQAERRRTNWAVCAVKK